jgi:iron complex outermembrane recepter protein
MAVSRSVRTPSRADEDRRINQKVFPPGTYASQIVVRSLLGNNDFESEELIAYELGYRVQPMDRLSLDIAAFFNDYDNLHTREPGEPFYETSPSPPHLVIPITADNKMEGETYGVELAANWQALDWWRLQAAYTYLQIQLHLAGDSECILAEKIEGESPHHQISFRSFMELFSDLEFDLWVRYVDNLPSQDIGSYITLDARLSWRPFNDLELSVVGQNLLDSDHPEFQPAMFATSLTEVERSVYGKITWSF